MDDVPIPTAPYRESIDCDRAQSRKSIKRLNKKIYKYENVQLALSGK